MALEKELINLFASYQLIISEKQANQFVKYYDKMVEVNKYMNLTAITDWEQVIVKHYLDSVMIGKYFDLKEKKVLDMGTGAGFPGIPLKILYPEIEITLVDSLNKRVKFLNEVVKELELKQIKALHARAEELGHQIEYREQYDYCVSRAVAPLPVLLEFCIPFLKVGGRFIAYKSVRAEEEIAQAANAIKLLNAKVETSYSFTLHFEDIELERNLLVIEKIAKNKKKYPRRPGTPAKLPL